MIDAKSLLDRFLTPQPGGTGLADQARNAFGRAASFGGSAAGGLGGFAGGAATGGLLGMLLGGKRRGGGVLSHGGAAVLGALAHRAWQNWQAGQTPATPAQAEPAALPPAFLPGATPTATGEAFELSLIRAMIAAAQSDGHIDAAERSRIFAQVEKAGLDAEAQAFVFDTLAQPVSVSAVAEAAATPEQASELYLASRLTVDPDAPAERAYLSALAHRLKLPPGLTAQLDQQALAAQ